MTGKSTKHQKIWFSRQDHQDLDRLPSAGAMQSQQNFHRSLRVVHGFSRALLWLSVLLVVGVGALVTVLATSGIANSYFTQLAQTTLQRLAGPNLKTGLTDATLSLDKFGNLAFEAQEITFAIKDTSADIASIGTMRMGLKALSLFSGEIQIGSLEIDNVLVNKIGDSANPSGLLAYFMRPDGVVTPAKVPSTVHNAIDRLRNEFSIRGLETVTLNNLNIVQSNSGAALPSIETMDLRQQNDGELALNGTVKLSGRTHLLAGTIFPNRFALDIDGLDFGTQTPEVDVAASDGTLPPIMPNASVRISLSGANSDTKPKIQLGLTIDRFDFRNSRGARLAGDGIVRFELEEGIDKIEILPSRITAGKNSGVFTGAIAPNDGQVVQGEAKYRFELVSNETSLQPEDSPEQRINAAVRIAGLIAPTAKEITFSEIGVRTLGGQLFGQGSVQFSTGSPELIFALRIPEMRVTDAKQLWPAIFAGGARRWVLNNVYGGTLTDSTINVSYAAGSLWPRAASVPMPLPTSEQVSADFIVKDARFDVIGDLPAIRDAQGTVSVRGANSTLTVSSGTAYLENGQLVKVSNGTMKIPVTTGAPVVAAIVIDVAGEAASLAEIANRNPINALKKAPIAAADLSGSATAHVEASFPLRKQDTSVEKKWNAEIAFTNLSIAKEFSGQKLSDADGTLSVTKALAVLTAKGKLNGIPATLSVSEPLVAGASKRDVTAKLTLDDKARAKIAPGLSDILKGPVDVSIAGNGADQILTADLGKATLTLPWAGWSKGSGIAAKASFAMAKAGSVTTIKDLKISGATFSMSGTVDVDGGNLARAEFSNVSLNKGDKIAVSLVRAKGGFDVAVSGASLDLRGLLKKVSGSFEQAAAATGGVAVRVKANIGAVTGFNGEKLRNVVASYSGQGSTVRSFVASAASEGGGAVALENKNSDGNRTVNIQTADGGALLRFMDIYDKMQGGRVNVSLSTKGDGPLSGEVDARGFTIVGEPRLKTLVGSPATPDGQSIAKVSKNKIDVSRVKFERGNAIIQKGAGYLKLDKGILRSDQIGLSYSGTLYDAKGRINMVGTFLPAYGLNRIFGELPIIGELLGNGRDKGLIGITFKLEGNAKSPTLSINPLSLIAPGIFRQIFEFQ